MVVIVPVPPLGARTVSAVAAGEVTLSVVAAPVLDNSPVPKIDNVGVVTVTLLFDVTVTLVKIVVKPPAPAVIPTGPPFNCNVPGSDSASNNTFVVGAIEIAPPEVEMMLGVALGPALIVKSADEDELMLIVVIAAEVDIVVDDPSVSIPEEIVKPPAAAPFTIVRLAFTTISPVALGVLNNTVPVTPGV